MMTTRATVRLQGLFSARHAATITACAIALVYALVYRDLFACRTTFSHDAAVWYGTFHYYLEHLKDGVFPYWDPYSQTGTFFYPNIAGYGLLDPVVLLFALISKVFSTDPFTLFIYFRLYRIFFFVIGAFLFFRRVSGNNLVAVLCSGILLFTVTLQNFTQPMMDYSYTIPLALYLVLLLLDNLSNRRRYGIYFLLSLVTGITMNVFIPAFFLFNIFFFTALLFVLRLYEVKPVLRRLVERKMALTLLCGAILVALMSAPSVSVSLIDTGEKGELFAVSKLVDGNDGRFKAMMASELGGDLLLDKLRKNQGAFLAPGSLLTFLTPYADTLRFRSPNDTAPIMLLFMGAASLVVLIAGITVVRSRMLFAVLFMAALVVFTALNQSVYGAYNPVQKLLNILFPPLRMIDTRLNFASVITFYLCAALSITASSLLNGNGLPRISPVRFRLLLGLPLAPAAAKILLNILLKKELFVSYHDGMLLLAGLSTAVFLLFIRRGILTSIPLVFTALLLANTELLYVSAFAAANMPTSRSVHLALQGADDYRRMSETESFRAYEGFTYFRLPYVPKYVFPLAAFNEVIVEVKSAFLNNSFGSIFTTKRYYDLFSRLSPERHYLVDGVMYPIVSFIPADNVVVFGNRLAVLSALQSADAEEMGRRLFVERDFTDAPVRHSSAGESGDLSWYGTNYPDAVYTGAIPQMKKVRINIGRILNSGSWSIQVERFSINEISLAVENSVEGSLLYADGWSRYWKAYDNGVEIAVVPANYNAKAVSLQPGHHLVRFVFSPTYYKTSLVMFYAGLVITVGTIIAGWKRES